MQKVFDYIHVVLFTAILLSVGILSFVLPKNTISVVEKRKLAQMPGFTTKSLFKGDYFDSLDYYYSDNFPFRDVFVKYSFASKKFRGLKSEEISIYHTQKVPEKPMPGVKVAPGSEYRNDSSLTGEVNKGIFICDNRAYELFGGSTKMSKLYANAINKYAQVLGDSVNVYCAVVPTAAEFYLPTKYKKLSRSEKTIIDLIYQNLDPKVKPVDAYSEIAPHWDEYIYFNTDHHWTGKGAYYAYAAFCKKAEITPPALDAKLKKTIKGFYGSLYWLTRDPKLDKSIDSVEYYKFPVQSKAYVYQSSTLKNPLKSSTLVEFAKGSNAYSVFLGGDYPFIRIETNVKNGRKAMIVKNSFGNPFATYFISNYETVYVVDYRYFEGGIVDIIKTNKINDLVFVHATFAANTSWHISRLGHIMFSKTSKSPVFAADTVKPKQIKKVK